MKAIGEWWYDDGTLKAKSPNLPTLSFVRPCELAESRFNTDDAPADLDLGFGKDLLTAAFGIVPFAREPLPNPFFGGGVSAPAQDAFRLFLGINADQPADEFKVLRGEPDDFLVFARRYHDVWKVGAFTAEETTLTFRFEDVWEKLPEDARFSDYLVEVYRDAHLPREEEPVREVLEHVAPDARISLDLVAGGGFTLTFWPVAESRLR